jgi:hypothetical protein
VIHAANNFPTWSDAPLQRLMQEALGKPAKVVNDADAAILAELWVGCAKDGIHDFIMISTGYGACRPVEHESLDLTGVSLYMQRLVPAWATAS